MLLFRPKQILGWLVGVLAEPFARKMAYRSLGKLSTKSSALFLCDMQEKFRNGIKYFPQIVEVSRRMLKAADKLSISTIVTEQYPKGNYRSLRNFVYLIIVSLIA